MRCLGEEIKECRKVPGSIPGPGNLFAGKCFWDSKARLTIPMVDAAPRHRTTDFLVGFSSTMTLVAGSDTISTWSSSSASETRNRSGSSRQRETRRSFVTTCDADILIKRCCIASRAMHRTETFLDSCLKRTTKNSSVNRWCSHSFPSTQWW